MLGNNACKRSFQEALASRCLKQRCSTSNMIVTAVLAPGEAPSSAASEPSLEATTSVPSCSRPPCLLRLMICTRWSATDRLQSSERAVGMNCCSASWRSSGLWRS